MSNYLFVDSSAWIALASVNDQYHTQARAFFLKELQSSRRLLTTNFVLNETLTLLRYRFGLPIAEKFWATIQQAHSSGQLELYYIQEDIWEESLNIFFRYRDQDFSITDCTSFALLKRRGIEAVFAFDHHFLVMGYIVEPRV